MCKMFAAAGRFGALDVDERIKFHKFMGDLFSSTQYDGQDQDAAGFYSFSGDRRHHDRSAGDARHITRTSNEWALMKQNPCMMYLCHARGAMSDASDPNNNHPFVGENVALMHEGWLSTHRAEAERRRLSLTSETDSEFYMRFADFVAQPIEGGRDWDPVLCMSEMLNVTVEPTALCFIDHSSECPQIWFGKNKSPGNHPFVFYRIKRFKGVFLVSTIEMMAIAAACAIPGTEIEKLEFDVEPFKTYKMDGLHATVTTY